MKRVWRGVKWRRVRDNLELCGGDFVEMVSDSVIGVDFWVGVWGDHVPGIG